MDLGEPSKFTTELETKLVPLTVIVKVVSPTVLKVGLILVVVGVPLLTVKVCALESAWTGDGLATVISKVPAVVRSLVNIEAVNWLELTKVVVRELPANFTTAPFTKLLPLTVRVKPVSPAFLLVGEISVVTGVGL